MTTVYSAPKLIPVSVETSDRILMERERWATDSGTSFSFLIFAPLTKRYPRFPITYFVFFCLSYQDPGGPPPRRLCWVPHLFCAMKLDYRLAFFFSPCFFFFFLLLLHVLHRSWSRRLRIRVLLQDPENETSFRTSFLTLPHISSLFVLDTEFTTAK